MSEKECPRCGDKFRCEGDRDCWCEKVNIHKVQMLEILELYTDCLCPNCLANFTASD